MPRERHSNELPENVKSVLAGMEIHALENPRTRNVTRELGTLLYMTAKLKQANETVEVGTSNGFSTIYLAQAAKENGGHVTTIEKQAEKSQDAILNLKKAGLVDFVDVITGQAQEVLSRATEPIDFLFMDILPGEYLGCIQKCKSSLKKGAIIICDNFMGHRNRSGQFTNRGEDGNDFIEFAQNNFKSVSEILNIGSGIIICTV